MLSSRLRMLAHRQTCLICYFWSTFSDVVTSSNLDQAYALDYERRSRGYCVIRSA